MSGHSIETDDEVHIPRGVTFIASLLLWVGGAASVLIAALGTADALSSFLRGRPIAGAVEFTQLALVTLVFTVQPYVLVQRAHIRLDLIRYRPGSLGGWLTSVLTFAAALLCYGLIAYTSWFGFVTSLEARESTEGVIALPVYPVKGLLFLGATIAFAIVVFFLARNIFLTISRPSRTAREKRWTP